ncbi:MAG TPA: zinc ribbon domain-containing protein [Ktedonobacteraceae bacterium]|nr:zinc ribbon domain-containing protein [Ktedonobacteraceae bacterium]
MVFCGKCGFQLTSGYITCPRCGTPTETEIPSDASQPDSPTIAASTIQGGIPSYSGSQETISPGRSREQQPLILGSPQPGYGSMEQMANEATNMMGTQYPTSAQEPTRTVYPNYVQPDATQYSQQGTSYSGYASATTSYQHITASQEAAEKVRARGRITGLLLILFGLLFILGAMVLFLLTRSTSTSNPASIQQTHVVVVMAFLHLTSHI